MRLLLASISLVAIAGALYLYASPPAPPTPTPVASAITPPDDEAERQWAEMIRSEELIFDWSESMQDLAFSVRNLEFPDERTRRLFWPVISVTDLAPQPRSTAVALGLGIQSDGVPIAPRVNDLSSTDVRLWRSLLDQVHHFANAKFKIKKGAFLPGEPGDPEQFETKVAFSGLARLVSGEWSWIRIRQTVRWRLLSSDAPESADNWRIVEWRTDEATRVDASAPLFREVLDEALPDPAQYERARTSLHERLVAKAILKFRGEGEFEPPHELFNYPANERHPGLAVVDVDRDGYDDLYAMERWGPNQLLRNRGDGTFEEVAAEVGLDLEGHSSSAVFADFDNDGDADVFVGRTLARSALLENVDGRFVDRSSEWVDRPLPFLASSVTAVDYDGDGLLDVYVSTYFAQRNFADAAEHMLEHGDQVEWNRLISETNPSETFINMAGPPNVLLHNLGGGRFEVVDGRGPLKAFRHTYQATWADFDADGDPDVYLANDFAPDNLIRNDGDGKFTDVTQKFGFDQLGLAMGVSWGDYDRDGRQDLYVSNMYSTAGTRITEKLPYLDPRFGQIAQGNYLFRNEGNRFRKVSGKDPNSLQVEETGWSWGSQFADIDNDAFQDILVLNGFYTAPPEVEIAGDT